MHDNYLRKKKILKNLFSAFNNVNRNNHCMGGTTGYDSTDHTLEIIHKIMFFLMHFFGLINFDIEEYINKYYFNLII